MPSKNQKKKIQVKKEKRRFKALKKLIEKFQDENDTSLIFNEEELNPEQNANQ